MAAAVHCLLKAGYVCIANTEERAADLLRGAPVAGTQAAVVDLRDDQPSSSADKMLVDNESCSPAALAVESQTLD